LLNKDGMPKSEKIGVWDKKGCQENKDMGIFS
jgi:hypothetical protein